MTPKKQYYKGKRKMSISGSATTAPKAKRLHPGMGQAVASRTILRRKNNGKFETWGDVAKRVAHGNALLCPDAKDFANEYNLLHKHIAHATLLMSGRHLQHGDEDQPNRPKEVFTNCATSSTSFLLFLLLLSGSGVGRAYDDDLMLVNWDNAPTLRCVLSEEHPDFDWSAHESVRDALHKYGPDSKNVMWFRIPDSREGWATALEIWEVGAFEKIHKDKVLILDFSDVRCKGTPIKGVQNRPASGPVPLMNAFMKAASIKGCDMEPWKQFMYIDHYFSECVLVGGARRAARMSTKYWKDTTVLDFIRIKRPIEFNGKNVEQVAEYRASNPTAFGFLWSSNNSVTVDEEFWKLLDLKKNDSAFQSEIAKHARKVFRAIAQCSYGDGTGEPGIINVDKLKQNDEGWQELASGDYVGSKKFQVREETELYLSRLAKRAKKKRFNMITNPSLRAGTKVLTYDGIFPIEELDGKKFKVRNLKGNWADASCWLSGNKALYKITLLGGHEYYSTAEHKWPVIEKNHVTRTKTTDLNPGDLFPVIQHNELFDSDFGSKDEGFLIGWNLGDGWISERSDGKQIGFICSEVDTQNGCKDRLISILEGLDWTGNFRNKSEINVNNKKFKELFLKFGVNHKSEGLPSSVFTASEDFRRGIIDGIFSSDGSVSDTHGIILTSAHQKLIKDVSDLLGFYGIKTTIFHSYSNLKGKLFDRYDLKISNILSVKHFNDIFKLSHKKKQTKIEDFINRDCYQNVRKSDRIKVLFVEKTDLVEPVWDIRVEDDTHCFQLSHCITGNCGEIALNVLGGYCVIADVVPFHCDTLEEAEEAFRVATRALIRVNTMDCIYKKEDLRTNRIGVGMTGVHEFAWKFFRVGFRDLIDPAFEAQVGNGKIPNFHQDYWNQYPPRVRAAAFWRTLSAFNAAVKEEAEKYSKKLGLVTPHTSLTIKPAGTTSKLFGLTEGWHLPSMAFFLRWVQFSNDDPLVDDYKKAGYPVKKLKSYENTSIIGFPTAPVISTLGMEDKLVTASEATPEEQYKWLQLGEKYWLKGEGEDLGNQISYTLKYDPAVIDFKHFVLMLKKYQQLVKVCSVLPVSNTSAYEYLPETAVTKAEYEEIAHQIQTILDEDVSYEEIAECERCAVDWTENKEVGAVV